jgi:fumarate hydratase class II
MTDYRIEKDSLGEVKVPEKKYWGAQTQRSLENFKIGSDKIPIILIQSFAMQKKAALISNLALGNIDSKIGEEMMKVCDEIINGNLNDHFPLSVWQTGSGTQTNMNLNEVIANKTNENLGGKLGSYDPVNPNDHCNLGQSSNDSFPTAMHISIILSTQKALIPAINKLIKTLEKKEREFKNIIKVGRTHLQDATPITIAQEFSGYKTQIRNALKRIEFSYEELLFLAQGGTAVGTGINTSLKFIKGFIKAIQIITGLPFKESKNKFESLSSHEPIIFFSAALNTLVVACYKIANDLRLLASGPRCGIGEIILPSNEPGSSIMPGKVNPTQCEAMAQVCSHVIGLYHSNIFSGTQGHFQLNANKTVLAFNTLRSIQLISDTINSFSEKCIEKVIANKERINKNLKNTLMLVTALNPKIGYNKAAEIAKMAHKENITLKEAALKLNYLNEKEFDSIVDAKKMIKID